LDLSKAAVDNSVDNVLTKDVFPESTCPKIPTLTFNTWSGVGVGDAAASEEVGVVVVVVVLLLLLLSGMLL
jgi:hypothetical protein